MSLFRLDASIRVDGSASREIADIVEEEWVATHPGDAVVRRHLGVDPLPPTRGPRPRPASRRRTSGTEQHAALTLAADLTDELLRADAILLAVPLYNFGVSQHIKAWFDLVMTDPRAKGGRCCRASRWCWRRSAAAPTGRARRGRAGTTRPATCGGCWPTSGVPT